MVGTLKPRKERKEQERGADIDLVANRLPERPVNSVAEERIVRLYEKYVETNPERARELLKRCMELTERYRPPDEVRNLIAAEAGPKIGLSAARLRKLCNEGLLGEQTKEGMRFSEREIFDYLITRRRVGRPKKTSQST